MFKYFDVYQSIKGSRTIIPKNLNPPLWTKIHLVKVLLILKIVQED